ncbi:MAG: GPP34 family phosphoprotein, partial [Acidobacteria bacterium]|nr:GPP34 family phosphoprotein [Acidobacteriota bacterium]
MTIRFAEEILLLILDEEHGDLPRSYSEHLLDIVVAGAVLMDLALEGRIDTDLEKLVLVDSTPLEDELLDPTLADVAAGPSYRNADYWIARTAERGKEIRERALARLVENGILETDAGGMFFSSAVSRSRRYPTRDGGQMEEVRLRIMRVLFSDEIPDPRDVVLICLSDASGV